MPMCQDELNSHLQSLHAKITNVENQVMAHYQALSTFMTSVAASASDHGTKAAAIVQTAWYNSTSSGFTTLANLIANLPIVQEIRQLNNLTAAQIVESIGSELEAMATDIVGNAVSAAATAALSVVDAEAAYLEAVAAGSAAEVIAPLLQAYQEAQAAYQTAMAVQNNVATLLTSLIDISSCKATNMRITKQGLL